MARAKRGDATGWTPSQVVAHNLTRARELRRMSQSEVASRLSRFAGTSWSATTVAQAEGSVSGNRVRQFTANELVALARTFDLPVLYFFLPPEDGAGSLRTPDGPARGWAWEYLLLLVWGHTGSFPSVAARAAPWAHASPVVAPVDDLLDPDPNPVIRRVERARDRLTPEDMLAVAFNGLARRAVRGALTHDEDLDTFAQNLRRLADSLETFHHGRPGEFFDGETLRRLMRNPEDLEGDPGKG